MNKSMKTMCLAARILQVQYRCYARPMWDADGLPMLLVWRAAKREDVDLALPDHRIRLGRSGVTWTMDGTVITGTLAGGKAIADIVHQTMTSVHGRR